MEVLVLERIKINDIGNSSPEGMYILKSEVKKIKLLSAITIILSIILTFMNLSLKRNKQ